MDTPTPCRALKERPLKNLGYTFDQQAGTVTSPNGRARETWRLRGPALMTMG